MTIRINRRRALAAGLSLALPASAVRAQNAWPEKPIRIVVTFAAGGAQDASARALAEGLGPALGATIVENKPGGAGMIGTELVARSAPDGYTFLSESWGNVVCTPHIYGDAAKVRVLRDLTPVALTHFADHVCIANPRALDVASMADLVAAAKTRKEPIRMGTAGNGSGTHMLGELFQSVSGVRFLTVPYKGSGPAMTDLLGGHIDIMFDSLASAAPHVLAGNLRALGLIAAQRDARLPDVPTFKEAGFERASAIGWGAIFAPQGTPPAIVGRMASTLRDLVTTEPTAGRMRKIGLTPTPVIGAEFEAFLRQENARWEKVITERGIKPA